MLTEGRRRKRDKEKEWAKRKIKHITLWSSFLESNCTPPFCSPSSSPLNYAGVYIVYFEHNTFQSLPLLKYVNQKIRSWDSVFNISTNCLVKLWLHLIQMFRHTDKLTNKLMQITYIKSGEASSIEDRSSSSG